MLPQSDVLILAPIAGGREDELRQLLEELNQMPGLADSMNPLVPFRAFDRLHLARLMILADPAPDDIRVYGLPPASFPPSLAFFADCDGPADEFLAELARYANAGLRRIFACCADFDANTDVLQFMREHLQASAAAYVNWIGRTVRQIREEAALREAMTNYLDTNAPHLANETLSGVHRRLGAFVDTQIQSGALRLTSPEPTPAGWRFRNALHLIGVPLLLILVSPFLLVYLPFFLWLLRRHETRDAEILPRPDPARPGRDRAAPFRDPPSAPGPCFIRPPPRRAAGVFSARLFGVAVDLKAGYSKTRNTMPLERAFPGTEFGLR